MATAATAPKNVLMPLDLMKKIVDLLGYWDLSSYDDVIIAEYDFVMAALMKKQQSLDLRQAYSHMLFAKDDSSRDDARVQYLHQKNRLYN